MKGIKFGIVISFLLILLFGPAALGSAAEEKSIIKIGSDVVIEEGQKVRNVVTIGGQITVSGDVDLTLPAPAKVNLSMRSVSGEIYTDFDLNLGSGNMRHVGGQTVEGRANGGGVKFSLNSVSGDVFVRKSR